MEVFKYLGRLLAQDDDDIKAICTQVRKARATWTCVGQVLWSKNAPPPPRKFYKAIVQAMLLYGSKTFGFPLQQPWLDWRGSNSALPIGWQSRTSRAGGRDMSGFIRGQRMCWRSADCIPLQSKLMSVGR